MFTFYYISTSVICLQFIMYRRQWYVYSLITIIVSYMYYQRLVCLQYCKINQCQLYSGAYIFVTISVSDVYSFVTISVSDMFTVLLRSVWVVCLQFCYMYDQFCYDQCEWYVYSFVTIGVSDMFTILLRSVWVICFIVSFVTISVNGECIYM